MAKRIARGIILKLEIASVLTAVELIVDFDISAAGTELVEVDTLDEADEHIPRGRTGRVTSPDITGNMFYDALSARHQLIDDEISDPSTNPDGVAGQIVHTGIVTMDFVVIGFQAGDSYKLNDKVRRPFTLNTNGITRTPAV